VLLRNLIILTANNLSQRLGDLDAGKRTFEAKQEAGKLGASPNSDRIDCRRKATRIKMDDAIASDI
jgi:hypothetical protein